MSSQVRGEQTFVAPVSISAYNNVFTSLNLFCTSVVTCIESLPVYAGGLQLY